MAERNRPTPEGRRLGEQIARLTEKAIKALAAEGEADERCASCAYRSGTFPNGCPETVLDALKCTIEAHPFLCHAPHDGRPCFGWYASRVALKGATGKVPYEFTTHESWTDPEKVKEMQDAIKKGEFVLPD